MFLKGMCHSLALWGERVAQISQSGCMGESWACAESEYGAAGATGTRGEG